MAKKQVLNQSKNLFEDAEHKKCPRCSGFGGVFGDEDGCHICNGYGSCWVTQSGWTLAPYARSSKSQLY